MTIGERIAVLRRRRGITQRQMAHKLRCSHSLICRIERGSVMPTLERLVQIAVVLGVRPEDLLSDRLLVEENRESA